MPEARAIVFKDGEAVWTQLEHRALQANEVRIQIAATAVNRADLMQRQGLYPAPPGYSDIPGLECSGEIIEVGAGVQDLAVGMQVCALLSAGGYASEVVCDAGQVVEIPAGIDLIDAAGIPEVFATAWFNLVDKATLQADEKVLVKAGGSGVGTAVIQVCRLRGNPVYVQVGSEEKLERCLALGASGGIDRHQSTLADLAKAGPFDVIVDPVAGGSLADTLPLLNIDGRLVVLGLMGGLSGELDFGRLLVKRLNIIGSTLRAQSVSVKTALMAALRQELWPAFASGQIRPIIEQRFAISELDAAHELIESNQTFGKCLLLL